MTVAVVHQEFYIQTDYAYQQVFIEINGIDFTNCAAMKGRNHSEQLFTDSEGRLEGDLIIFDPYSGLNIFSSSTVDVYFFIKTPTSSNNYQRTYERTEGLTSSQLGEIDIPGSNFAVRKIIVAILRMKVVGAGTDSRSPNDVGVSNEIKINDSGTINTAINSNLTARENTNISVLLPMAQTFFVDARSYPNGVFTTSVELYFSEKSDTELHVMVDLREVIDGVPSTKQLSGSFASLNKNNINVPTSVTLGPTVSTKFKFANPIYLYPGKEYAIAIKTPDNNYKIFTNVIGKTKLDGTTVSSKNPNVGKLFKITNTSSQVEEQGTSLVFKINKAVFETGTKSFIKQNAKINPVKFEYNISEIDVAQKVFGSDALTSVDISTVNSLTNQSTDYINVPWNLPFRHSTKKDITNEGDVKVKVIMTNKDKNISPILDLSTLKLYTIKYEIDNINDVSRIRPSELVYTNGLGKAKYISKIITLNPDFDSTGIEIKLDLNRKNNTDIDVFCRVKSSLDNGVGSTIENRPWTYVPLYSSANSISTSSTNYSIIPPPKPSVGTNEFAYISETYRILETDSSNLGYDAIVDGYNVFFNTFNQFQIKLVMYGDTSNSLVPKVKNLIATAVI